MFVEEVKGEQSSVGSRTLMMESNRDIIIVKGVKADGTRILAVNLAGYDTGRALPFSSREVAEVRP